MPWTGDLRARMVHSARFQWHAAMVLFALLAAACSGPAVSPSGTNAGLLGTDPAPSDTTPTISGVPDGNATAGVAYEFKPDAADADGDALTFSIDNAPAWTAFDSQTGELSGTPEVTDVATYSDIVISVSDGIHSTSLPAFDIVVSRGSEPPPPPPPPGIENHPPVIDGSPATAVVKGNTYSFQPGASDPDGDALVFSILNKPVWLEFSTATGKLSGSSSGAVVKTYSNIIISVSDGRDTSSLQAFSIDVQPGANSVPVITGSPATRVQAMQTYVFQIKASDADGDRLTFSIRNKPAWAAFSSTTGRLSGTPTEAQRGSYPNIVISVSDGNATASLPAFAITVTDAPNAAPTIGGSPAPTVTVGSAYSFTPVASDEDGDPLTFSIQNKPTWANFSSTTGRLSGTPSASQIGTTAGVVISVSDGRASASLAPFDLTVSGPPNHAPVISGNPGSTVAAGSAYRFAPTASDADGDSLRFTIQNKPVWASFSASTGVLSGTPGASQAGTYANIIISVSDGSDTASLRAFTIMVTATVSGNSPPAISGVPAKSVIVGASYGFTPTASDSNGDALTFSVQNLPPWASFSSSTGRLSGTPADADVGSYANIVISVSDGKATTSLGAFTVLVAQTANGTAELQWTAPTRNTDGSALLDLAGFRVYYGTNANLLNQSVTLTGPSVTTYVVQNLTPGTWYFAVRAYDTSGLESGYSNVGSKVIP